MKISKSQLKQLITEARTGMIGGIGFAPPVQEVRREDNQPDPELTKKVLSELDDLTRLVRGGHVNQGDLDYIDGEIVDILNRVFSKTMVMR